MKPLKRRAQLPIIWRMNTSLKLVAALALAAHLAAAAAIFWPSR